MDFSLVLSVVALGALLAAVVKAGELHSTYRARRRAASAIAELQANTNPDPPTQSTRV